MTSKLNLVSVFQNIADELLIQVRKGADLHKSKNIKASGKPFEAAFRKLLKDGFPSSFVVSSGYFYGVDEAVSSEVDVIVSREEDTYKLVPAPVEDAYIPFSSLELLGQLKNSSNQLADALSQISSNIKQFERMREHKLNPQLSSVNEPLAFVVCGKDMPKDVILKSDDLKFTQYVLLLEEGKIIASEGRPLFNGDSLSLAVASNKGGDYVIWEPDPKHVSNKEKQGAALLWFYYALIDKMNTSKKPQLHDAFCKKIVRDYPLVRVSNCD